MTQHRAHRSAQPAIAVVAVDQGNPACSIEPRDARRRPAFERSLGGKVPWDHALVGRGTRRGDAGEAVIGVENAKLGGGDLEAVGGMAVACVQKLRPWQAKEEREVS